MNLALLLGDAGLWLGQPARQLRLAGGYRVAQAELDIGQRPAPAFERYGAIGPRRIGALFALGPGLGGYARQLLLDRRYRQRWF